MTDLCPFDNAADAEDPCSILADCGYRYLPWSVNDQCLDIGARPVSRCFDAGDTEDGWLPYDCDTRWTRLRVVDPTCERWEPLSIAQLCSASMELP